MSVSFNVDVHQDLCGRPSVLYRKKTWYLCKFVSFHMDAYQDNYDVSIRIYTAVHHYIRGRPLVSIRTRIRITVNVRKNIYGCPLEHLWTFISLLVSIRTFKDIHQLSSRCPSRPLVGVHQNIQGHPSAFIQMSIWTSCWCPSELSMTSIRLYMAINHNVCGRPSEHSWTSVRFSYGRILGPLVGVHLYSNRRM